MCSLCDGSTYEEVLDDLHHIVQHFGWALQGVKASPPWVYTIGLIERFDHPELVLAGVDISVAMGVLNALGTMIATGERLEPGRSGVSVAEVEVAFGSVHPVHISAGLVGMWQERYARQPGVPPPLEVVQVLPLPGRRLPLDKPYTTLC
ncbi:MAG: DUF4262 domain-containing protein [Acidimicrobiales bacterium]